ncbi:hypothetical protein ABT187_49985, partial [Streptomyces sp. NPDC001817]|uniref:hypothetical protein n=1 Tax=Streptomyces sp. NPDC001817 TaxID=3154398 RepID=UPI0033219E73
NPYDHTQYTPARTYTPDGYFTTRDTWQLHNRYQAFDTNPAEYTDPSGNKPLTIRTKHQKAQQKNAKRNAMIADMKASWYTTPPPSSRGEVATPVAASPDGLRQNLTVVTSPMQTQVTGPEFSDPRFAQQKSGFMGVISPLSITSVPMGTMQPYGAIGKTIKTGNVSATVKALSSYRNLLEKYLDYHGGPRNGICAQTNLATLLTLSSGRTYVPSAQAVAISRYDLAETFGEPLADGDYIQAAEAINNLRTGEIAILDAKVKDVNIGHVAIILKGDVGQIYIDAENDKFMPGMYFQNAVKGVMRSEDIEYRVYPGGTLHHSFK